MEVPTFYIETSVWRSLARRQPGDRRSLVERLVRLLDGDRGQSVISDVVIGEIRLASLPDAESIQRRIAAVQPVVLDITESAVRLAQCYIAAGILPSTRQADARHIAVATVNGIDYLVSWNHRHITGRGKREKYEQINRENGYEKSPTICNPKEAIDALRQQK